MSDSDNVYRDSAHRMNHDPAFRAVVTFLVKAAEEHGFTPGELKQMAFQAAYEVEMRNPRQRTP